MDQRFLDETVSRRPALFKAIADFNRSQLCSAVAASVRPSWEGLAPQLLKYPALRQAFCASPSSTASSHSGVTAGWWDFSEETRRLILIPPDDIRRAALCFSAAVYGDELARILDRTQVLELRSLLGADIFSYAIRRGRYQVGSLRQQLQNLSPSAPLPQRILPLSRAVLASVAESWPAPLRELWIKRLALADEHSAAEPSPLSQLSHEQRRALWFTLKKILLREAAPQWAPCFD